MLEKYIEIIKPYITELFKHDSSGHDISHLIRTMNISKRFTTQSKRYTKKYRFIRRHYQQNMLLYWASWKL